MKCLRIQAVAIAVSGSMAAAFLSLTAGAEEVPEHKLSEWSVGASMSGEKVDLKGQEGKVVAIEFWGTH